MLDIKKRKKSVISKEGYQRMIQRGREQGISNSLNPILIREIKEQYKYGCSVMQIHRLLGINDKTVRKYIDKYKGRNNKQINK